MDKYFLCSAVPGVVAPEEVDVLGEVHEVGHGGAQVHGVAPQLEPAHGARDRQQ